MLFEDISSSVEEPFMKATFCLMQNSLSSYAVITVTTTWHENLKELKAIFVPNLLFAWKTTEILRPKTRIYSEYKDIINKTSYCYTTPLQPSRTNQDIYLGKPCVS